jgi:hypothetical protein
MTKYNRNADPYRTRIQPPAAPLSVGIVNRATVAAAVPNHQGGEGYSRDPKSDLFLLATTSHDIGASAFYEGGNDRVRRYVDLIHTVAVDDPTWTAEFLAWLRGPGNIRTAAIVGAVEAARAMVTKGTPGGRQIVASVLQRADEPGEAIAYHLATHGRRLPKPIKRGIADAAVRLYNERALLKYDTGTHAVRFGDVLDLTHPTPAADRAHWQADLFRYAIDRRHGRTTGVDGLRNLDTIRRNTIVREAWAADPTGDSVLDVRTIDEAGLTWEDVLSAFPRADKAALWRALIPSMGFMARLRNLRNFDQAGVSDRDVADVLTMLTDPERVAKSRQLPMRFLSAHRAVSNLRWAYPLEQALDLSVRNIPALPGATLILIDTSGSMDSRLSEKSDLMRWDAAVVFGLALARRCESAAVVSYSEQMSWFGRNYDLAKQFPQQPGESLLHAINRFKTGGYFIGGGTDTTGAVQATFRPGVHDRVLILTDEQDGGSHHGNPGQHIPHNVPLYTINLAGYRHSNVPTINRYRITLGGLTDHMFSVIPTIESGGTGGWPWETEARQRQAVNDAAALPPGAYTRRQRPERSTIPEGSQGEQWAASDGEWTGRTTGHN